MTNPDSPEGPPQGAESAEGQKLLERLAPILPGWVGERTLLPQGASPIQALREKWTLPIGQERRARQMVVDSLAYELTRGPGAAEKGGKPIWLLGTPGFLWGFSRAEAIASGSVSRARRLISEGRRLETTEDDSVTGERITRTIEQGDGYPNFVAREIGADGRVVSEAALGHGNAGYRLTLNYEGPHYAGRNPAIIGEEHLPATTALVFSLIAGSVLRHFPE